jgi:hypothetical protein
MNRWYLFEPKSRTGVWALFFIAAFIFLCPVCHAEEMTCALVKQKVLEAVKLYTEKGDASYPLLKDPKGGFLFGEKMIEEGGKETYSGFIFIIDLAHVMLMHANNPNLEGVNFTGKKDKKGNLFVEEYVSAAKGNPAGAWVEYYWPMKKDGAPHKKATFVHLAAHKDKTIVIGSGVFDISKEECEKAAR